MDFEEAQRELRRQDAEDAAAKALIKIGLGVIVGMLAAAIVLAVI